MKIILKIVNRILKLIKIIKDINKYINFKKLWDDFKEKNENELDNNKRIRRPRNFRGHKEK